MRCFTFGEGIQSLQNPVYVKSISEFRLTIFQVLNSQKWLGAIVVGQHNVDDKVNLFQIFLP